MHFKFCEHWKVPWWSTAAFIVAQAFVSLRIVTPSDGTRIEPGKVVRTAEGASIALLGEPASALLTGDIVAAKVAAYCIVAETLTNVVRRAHAQHCIVRLFGDTTLSIEVGDDGNGLPVGLRAAVRLSSMRERAEELAARSTSSRRPEMERA